MDNSNRTIGLQIGGEVNPNDTVGMHIPMPKGPGVGVKVELGNQIDKEVKKILEEIPDNHPKANSLKVLAEGILEETDKNSKFQKVQNLIITGAGIVEIASGIAALAKLL